MLILFDLTQVCISHNVSPQRPYKLSWKIIQQNSIANSAKPKKIDATRGSHKKGGTNKTCSWYKWIGLELYNKKQ